MNEKKSFLLYCDYREHIKLLSVEEKAALLDAIFDYASGEKVEVEGAVGMAFSFIQAQIDRDTAKWEEKREKLRANGAKGGLAKASNAKQKLAKASNTKQGLANVAVNDNVNVNVNVNDINNINTSIDYDEIVTLFNNTCTSLSKIQRLTDKRKKAIKTRLKTFTIDDYKKAFQMVEESDFLSGRSGSWKASFDWLLNEANLTKVLEGNYKNNKTSRIEINPEFRRFQEEHELVHFNVN